MYVSAVEREKERERGGQLVSLAGRDRADLVRFPNDLRFYKLADDLQTMGLHMYIPSTLTVEEYAGSDFGQSVYLDSRRVFRVRFRTNFPFDLFPHHHLPRTLNLY
jgi:hypothetical protein